MVVHVIMNFLRWWNLHGRLLKMLWIFVGAMTCALKKWFCSLSLSIKKTKEFWKKVRKFKGNTTVSRWIDDISILQNIVKICDQNYKEVVDHSECQPHSVATDLMLHGTTFSFPLKDHDVAIDGLNLRTGFDSERTLHIKSSKRCFRNLICNFYNKLISHTNIRHSMLKGPYVQQIKTALEIKLIRKTTGL